MALQKQNYFLSITDGLDTKTDEKNVISTRFLELENLIFTKTGSVSKRLGYTALPTLGTGSALTTFQNELLAYSNKRLYAFSDTENKWYDKGSADIALATSHSVGSSGDIYTKPYMCKIGNLSCYTYLSESPSASNIAWKIIDDDTGSLIASGSIANGDRPRVQRLENKFIVSYILTGTLKAIAINSADATDISSPFTVLAGVSEYDCKLIGNRIFFGACKQTSGGVQVLFLKSDLSLSSAISVEGSGTFTQPDVSDSGVNDMRLCYVTGTPSIKTIIYSYDLIVSSGSATITGNYPFSVTAVNKQTSSDLYVSYKYSASPASQNHVSVINVNTAGTVGTPSILFYQVLAQSKAVTYNNVDYFIVSKDESNSTQRTVRTYFLVNSNGRIVAKFDEDNSIILSKSTPYGCLASIVLNGNTIEFVGTSLAEFQSEPVTALGALVTPTILRRHIADFSSTSNYFDTKLGENLHVAGGLLKAYDGAAIVEHGFLEVPRAPTLVSASASVLDPGLGSADSASNYQYIIVYAWRDNQGQLHRSAPSPALSVPLAQVTVDFFAVTLTLPTLTLTNKTNVEIELYRTEANGTTFYKVLENGSGAFMTRIFNSTTAASVTYVDTVADAAIITNEILYTTGGVLENIAAPASKYAVTYKNRVLLLSADGRSVTYSKLREINGPVEFNDSLSLVLDEFGGPATAMAVMDDNVIIFKERALFALTGEGPNNLGQQDDFRQPYLITSDAGCIEPNSIVRTPDSIMFKSDKGIYEVARNLQVSYIGAPVETYNANTVTSANLLETTNEIRFTTLEGRTLVYDYFHKRWTTFTNMAALDAMNYNNQYVYIRADGTVLKETQGYYLDQGSYIKTKLVSAWVSLAGIQGFERVYQLELLGSYKASHKLRVSMAYDFVNAYLHDTVINATTVLNPSYYGTGTFGSDTPYGGDGLLYHFRIFPKIQKCQSFKICIEDFPGTDSSGEAYTLSNIAATIGLKAGLNKLPAQRSFGTR